MSLLGSLFGSRSRRSAGDSERMNAHDEALIRTDIGRLDQTCAHSAQNPACEIQSAHARAVGVRDRQGEDRGLFVGRQSIPRHQFEQKLGVRGQG